MEKLTFYRSATWVMLVLNLILLVFLALPWIMPPGGPTRGMERALDKLELDREQRMIFRSTAEKHQENMKRIKVQQQNTLLAYFEPLATNQGSISPQLSQDYLKLTEEKVQATYQHFLEVKDMLRPEQQHLYEEWIGNAIQGILLQNPKKPGPPKD
ncbi:MAG: hypothetical protein AAF597_07855 [Bacteroidota bacterium]